MRTVISSDISLRKERKMSANYGDVAGVKAYAQIIARAWTDPNFKQKLLANPRQVLNQNGMNLPDTIESIKIDDGATTMTWDQGNTLVLPLPPKPADLSDDQLQNGLSGAEDVSVSACCCCCSC